MLPKRILDLASSLSYRSEFQHKVGAVVFKGSTVQGSGYNLRRTHPISVHYNQDELMPYPHAEVRALLSCKRLDLSKSSLVVVRRLKDGSFGTSKPCVGCMRAITKSGLRDLYFFENNELKTMRLS